MKPLPLVPVIGLVLHLAAAAPASAHEYWLAPSAWAAAPGDTVSFGALNGEDFIGDRIPLAPDRIVRLVARTSRESDLVPVARGGSFAWASLVVPDNGGVLLALESNFAHLTLDGEAFDHYLAEDGLDAPLATRRARGDRGPGRERYRRAVARPGALCRFRSRRAPGREHRGARA